MKNLSRLLPAPMLAAVLLLACFPTNAARRLGASPLTGLGVWQSTRSAGTAVPCV
jgi:hypothetical protein